jgi:hypothetical protein
MQDKNMTQPTAQNLSPIIARVCKHAVYTEHRFDKSKDLLTAKITNIHEDNSRSDSFISIENYKQPWHLVKEQHRKFMQPKDYLEERFCREYRSTRRDIPFEVRKQLFGVADRNATIYDVKSGKGIQYVFGLDQTTPVHFKQQFFKKYAEYQEKEPYSVAAFDVEADMEAFGEVKPIMMASVTMKGKAYWAGQRSWFQSRQDRIDPKVRLTDFAILAELKAAEKKYIQEHVDRRKCEIVYELFDTPGQIAFACIQKFHEWSPDWVLSWNAGYDMEACERALRSEGYNLADVYSDPSVPREYRSYELNLGRTHKVKENGDKTPLEPQEKFPTVRTPARWQWADAMSGYAIKRFSSGKLESYSLESIATREGVKGKLYTEEGMSKGPGSGQWHRYMQQEHPYLYSMYNIADNWPIEEINEQTFDFSLSIPMLLRYSEYFNFVSQPRLISDTLSFLAREHGYVWGSTPAKRDKTFSDRLPTLDNWIALLDTEKNSDMGRAMFIGLDDVISSGRSGVSDLDVEGAYPHGTLAANTSNKTTQMEVYAIQGANDMKFREIAVNYASSTQANAMGLSHDLFRFPQADKLQSDFEKGLEELGYADMLKQLRESAAKAKAEREAREAAVLPEALKKAA